MKYFLTIILAVMSLQSKGQQAWTMSRCMQYAVAHNHNVRCLALELDNAKADRTGAAGRFLPSVDGGIGAQYNFGRAIDPETNVYTNVSTFYNSYYVSASLPVFDGLGRVYALKAAKAGELMGRQALRQAQDLSALSVLQAFAQVAYYQGMVAMAREKVEEMTLLARQIRLMEEVGRKSAADVAQVASQQAEATYELTRQHHLYASAMLELKRVMAFPLDDTLSVAIDESSCAPLEAVECHVLQETHPELQAARYRVQVSKYEWRQARAAFSPSLSLGAGLNTTYYHTLHSHVGPSFSNQIRNNMGQYVAATLSIPLFNRLQTITNVRKARNNYRIAQENYAEKRLELEKLSREAWQDWQGYQQQVVQMQHKVEADSTAYQLTRRQFEEGLSTAIDLHATSTQLLQSKATLLQCRLMAMVKEQLVRYYQGETIWTK